MPTQERSHGGRMVRKILAQATMAVAAISAAPAFGQALDEKYWIEVSAYRPGIDTSLNIARPGAPGTDVDVESDLGLDKHEVLPAVYAGVRLGGRWVVLGEFYALDRSGSRALTRDLVIDGATYRVGATLESKLQSDVYRVTVGYSFLRSETGELGAAIGLHATDFDFRTEGTAQIGAAAPAIATRRRSFLAPLPTVGIYGTYQPAPKVILNGRVDYLSLGIKDYDGGILNAQASVGYQVTSGISVGLAYRYVAYDLDVKKTAYTAKIDYDFSGPSVFLRAGFR